MKLARPEIFRPLLYSIFAGLFCNFIWLYEIINIKGWYGLYWLNGYMLSVFLIIPITVASFIISLRKISDIGLKYFVISTSILTIVSLISFEIAREVLFSIYSRFFFLSHSLSVSIIIIMIGILIPTSIFSIGYYFITNKLIIKISWKAIILFILSLIFSIVCGLLTIKIYSGFGTGRTFIDSVKMGYPIFWLNISFGLISIILIRLRPKG